MRLGIVPSYNAQDAVRDCAFLGDAQAAQAEDSEGMLSLASSAAADFTGRLDALDVALLGHVELQMTDEDRISLLALHSVVAKRYGTFGYMEIGSYRGGSLQSFVADPRCTRIVSIDARVDEQADDRGTPVAYEDNSTEAMLRALSAVPGAELSKLQAIELASSEIDARSLPPVSLCLIDGEHTEPAALTDARLCLNAIGSAGVIAFHDRSVIKPAIRRFLSELRVAHRAYPLRDELFVIEVGARSLLSSPTLRARVEPPMWAWVAANLLGAPELALRDSVRHLPLLGARVRARCAYWRALAPIAIGGVDQQGCRRPAPIRALRLALSRRPQP